MGFTNVQVDLDSLPRFDRVAFQRVDPRHRRVVLALTLAAELIVLLGFAGMVSTSPDGRALFSGPAGMFIILGLLLAAAALAAFAYASASVIRYAVREHDVIVHKGVFFQRETLQPIRRIQHVEQRQGPIARRFGLYSIRLFSAGTAKFTFEIPGLSADTAARLRQAILKLREQKLAEPPESAGDAGQPDGDDSGEPDGAATASRDGL